MSRREPNKGVFTDLRIDGTIAGGSGDCNTIGNNKRYLDNIQNGATADNWRFISIHFNSSATASFQRVEVFRKVPVVAPIPLADHLAESVMFQVNRAYPHQQTPYWGNWTRAYEQEACGVGWTLPCDLFVVRKSLPRAYDDPPPRSYHHGSYNILTESGYISEPNFNQWIQNENNQQALAEAHMRGLVDFFVVGKRDSIQNMYPGTFNEYRSNINAGKDPGTPFNNGGGYYVHRWGDAWTQEFRTSNQVTKGSILECFSTPSNPCSSQGGGGYYVRQPIWDTYIQKGGPVKDGPGRPWGTDGHEHNWNNTSKYVHGQTFVYPKTQNFENGAIYWNSYESSIRQGQQTHAIFLPNCKAADINGVPDLAPYMRDMIGRFALSNDAAGPVPQPTPLPGFNDGKVHGSSYGTRAQLAQSLVWAEGYPYHPENGSWEYGDIQGHWGRPFIRIAANLYIANGYPDGWRPDPYVTRSQFAKMESIARGWSLVNPVPPSGRCSVTCPCSGQTGGYYSFSDVCYGDTFYQYIETVKVHNGIGGYNTYPPCDSNSPIPCFKPVNNVTRAQMSKIVSAALASDGYPVPSPRCWGEAPP